MTVVLSTYLEIRGRYVDTVRAKSESLKNNILFESYAVSEAVVYGERVEQSRIHHM
jgi:hypothetical protein